MPVYRFTIGVTLEDPVGLECKSDADAKIKAAFIARQIAIDLDGDNEDRCVIVFDERRHRNSHGRCEALGPVTG
jgi:hypothetical protein